MPSLPITLLDSCKCVRGRKGQREPNIASVESVWAELGGKKHTEEMKEREKENIFLFIFLFLFFCGGVHASPLYECVRWQ